MDILNFKSHLNEPMPYEYSYIENTDHIEFHLVFHLFFTQEALPRLAHICMHLEATVVVFAVDQPIPTFIMEDLAGRVAEPLLLEFANL